MDLSVIGHRAAHRAAKLLARIGSSLSETEFVGLKKINPSLSPSNGSILPLRYDYRARPGDVVNLTCILDGDTASVRVHAADDPHQPWKAGKLILSSEIDFLKRGDVLTINLRRPSISRNNEKLQLQTASPPGSSDRRFITEIRHINGRKSYYRLCSHYLPFENKIIGKDYYFGDDYSDYPAQTDPQYAVNLLLKYGCKNRLLDVGCALGAYTKAFVDAGFDAYGIDISPFAIDQASRLVGPGRAKSADLDTEEIPFDGSFETIWMWDVLEHFKTPDAVLEKVSRRAIPGTKLALHTSNSDSLTRRCLARDWEGYSDYSHHGVDHITCATLRRWLDKTRWEIIDFSCSEIWTRGIDPVLLRLQEVFRCVPELAVLLTEAELGDFITVVACKR